MGTRLTGVCSSASHGASLCEVHPATLTQVTKGSYYLIQDTRLDRTCYAQKHWNHQRGTPQGTWSYCHNILGTEGGPARAVRYLECRSPTFRAAFEVDRAREEWIFTQHPRGYLRRRP